MEFLAARSSQAAYTNNSADYGGKIMLSQWPESFFAIVGVLTGCGVWYALREFPRTKADTGLKVLLLTIAGWTTSPIVESVVKFANYFSKEQAKVQVPSRIIVLIPMALVWLTLHLALTNKEPVSLSE